MILYAKQCNCLFCSIEAAREEDDMLDAAAGVFDEQERATELKPIDNNGATTVDIEMDDDDCDSDGDSSNDPEEASVENSFGEGDGKDLETQVPPMLCASCQRQWYVSVQSFSG